MSRLVILNLGKGNLQEGFSFVTAQLQSVDNAESKQYTGSLPTNPELIDCYHRWRLLYELLYQARSLNVRTPNNLISIDETDVTHVSDTDFEKLCQDLQNRIDRWLDVEEFRGIYLPLQKQLEPTQAIRFIIQTEDDRLRKIPWHTWRFFRDYRLAEVSFSPLNFDSATTIRKPTPKVRILAILGDSTGIDIGEDRSLLDNLPDANTVFLPEPDRKEVSEQLWNKQGWDILFFAGHSLTNENGNSGQIFINPHESISISQLKNALTEAIERGLQMAIFNSCDGLGLARQLADLNIPQIVVMREPVSDRVAQAFLKYFLSEFADNRPFDVAVRKARERLQGMEGEFPGASWLPVIFQNPAHTPPTWNDLYQKITPKKQAKSSWQAIILASLVCTLTVMGGRALGLYQEWELKSYDRQLQLKTAIKSNSEGRDERLLIVEVTQADTNALGGEYPISDRTLVRLLQQLNRHKPSGIGIDIIRDRPVGEGWNELVQYLKLNKNIVPPCSHPSNNDPGIASPTGNSSEQTGFIDVVKDPDGIVRRHLLAVDPADRSLCPAFYALSTKLAYRYLEAKGYTLNFPDLNTWEFANPDLKPYRFNALTSFNGFYQQPEQTQGHQILLNYRSYTSIEEIARRVSATEVLQGKVDPQLIRDRIILIGVTDPTLAKDEIATPYNQEIRGLMLQAQMVSQLLSAVEDGRPLLRFLPIWADALWILACSSIAIVLLWRFPSLVGLGIVGGLIIGVYGISFIILLVTSAIVPLIPSVIALVLPGIGAIFYILWQSDRKKSNV
jgi:CHASE2 domain-containing sensor protein